MEMTKTRQILEKQCADKSLGTQLTHMLKLKQYSFYLFFSTHRATVLAQG